MNISKLVNDIIRYITEAAARTFTTTEEVPSIGTQPFEGEPYSRWEDL